MIVMTCRNNHKSWGATDSTDEHTHILDEATMTKVHWRVKGSVTSDGDTGPFNTNKHSRWLQSQTGKPLGPIKAPLLGKSVTIETLTTHNS